ncbi:MAG: hypothetical protein V7K67_03605 [Nostoc sp.]
MLTVIFGDWGLGTGDWGLGIKGRGAEGKTYCNFSPTPSSPSSPY